MHTITQITTNFFIADIKSNKRYKMRYNLKYAKEHNYDTIVTFGGAYSNHIAATALYAKEQGLKTVGVIRGEELGVNLKETLLKNPTLRTASENGMQFIFVSRELYRKKNEEAFMQQFDTSSFGKYYLIPEGGTNTLAIKGTEEILNNATKEFDIICVPVGTGGTILGIINTAEKHQKVIGFSALKGDFLTKEISKYSNKNSSWQLIQEYHFGGFAKVTEELITFINEFNKQHQVLLDPIYNAKMVFGIQDLMQKDFFEEGKKILAIKTGGLQGIKGINTRLKKKNKTLINV